MICEFYGFNFVQIGMIMFTYSIEKNIITQNT